MQGLKEGVQENLHNIHFLKDKGKNQGRLYI